MSWSRRRLLALLAPAVIGGCGFHPLYAPRGNREFDADLASIKVVNIPNRLGQLLATSLRDGLNPTGASVPMRYILDVELRESRADLGYRSDGTTSRSQITVYVNFKLTDLQARKAVLSGSTRSVSAFDVQTDDYATVVAQHSAEERSLNDLSDDIQLRLAIYVRDRRAAARVS